MDRTPQYAIASMKTPLSHGWDVLFDTRIRKNGLIHGQNSQNGHRIRGKDLIYGRKVLEQ